MAWEHHDDPVDDLTEAAQRAYFEDAMDREASHEARHEASHEEQGQDEHCLVHEPSCVRGPDGRWHRPPGTH
jgi:hypothetical protein